jgi:acetyl esterase/lipase
MKQARPTSSITVDNAIPQSHAWLQSSLVRHVAARRALLLVVAAMIAPRTTLAAEPQPILLWPEGAPGAHGNTDNDKPWMTPYLPSGKATGTAVVVCPGGGYGGIAMDHEGKQVAQWLNDNGIAAFVLKYRHRGTGYGHPAPLQDVQRAIRVVRTRAAEWNIKPDHIGVLGFSAGGHLASSSGTHIAPADPNAADPVARVTSRPDFMVLIYPVISLIEPYTHGGSRQNLLGDNPPEDLVIAMSNERQVTSETPPTFLVHGNEDTGVPAENSLAFYAALRRAKVPAEMHIFEKGPHGFGLGKPGDEASVWPKLAIRWLQFRGMIPAAQPDSPPAK